LLELAVTGAGVGSVRVHADIRGDVIAPGDPGQQIGGGLEVESGMGLDQRGELEVVLAMGCIGGGHVD
jgi:hypothetical protein